MFVNMDCQVFVWWWRPELVRKVCLWKGGCFVIHRKNRLLHHLYSQTQLQMQKYKTLWLRQLLRSSSTSHFKILKILVDLSVQNDGLKNIYWIVDRGRPNFHQLAERRRLGPRDWKTTGIRERDHRSRDSRRPPSPYSRPETDLRWWRPRRPAEVRPRGIATRPVVTSLVGWGFAATPPVQQPSCPDWAASCCSASSERSVWGWK